jgi:chitinase
MNLPKTRSAMLLSAFMAVAALPGCGGGGGGAAPPAPPAPAPAPPAPAPPAPVPAPPPPAPAPAPGTPKIVGGYYPNWPPSPPRIRDVDVHYNLIYLFAATPVGGSPGTTGAVTFALPDDGIGAATNLVADIAYARTTQGRKIILSVGGAGNSMTFPTRAKSQAFVDSIAAIYTQLGGFDGLDWDTYEGISADTSEMIWISQQLKAKYAGFLITTPPAPWNPVDQTFCKAMLDAGVLDYAAPQYYDGPNLATQSYIVPNVATWVSLLGPTHVVVGFGIDAGVTNYMTKDEAISTWNAVEAATPTILGAFDWQINTDLAQGSPFAEGLALVINP